MTFFQIFDLQQIAPKRASFAIIVVLLSKQAVKNSLLIEVSSDVNFLLQD